MAHSYDDYGRRRNLSEETVRKSTPNNKVMIITVAVILFIICAMVVGCSSRSKVPQDSVGFTVGGGLIDGDKDKVKSELLKPGRSWIGLFDNTWTFPAYRTLRFQDFEQDVTTKDGKKLTLKGQVAFRFVGEKDPNLAREFALGIGARKYGGKRPGEGNDDGSDGEGWKNLLTQLMDPKINSSLKEGFGVVYCADFEPSCRSIDPRKDVPDTDPDSVYGPISGQLETRLTDKLGGHFFQDLKVEIKSIVLPADVQRNIDSVTSEQAKTKAAEQSNKTATAEAKTIRVKGRALRANKGLIALEVAKECRGGERCTIIVDASGKGVTSSVPAR